MRERRSATIGMATAEMETKGAGAEASASDIFARRDPPVLALTLWPNRSLSRRGFAWVMGIVAAGLALPILALLGTQAGLGLIPFSASALLALYVAIRRNYADGRLTEELRLWPDLITVERREPGGRRRRWHANPFWVKVRLTDGARIEKYLTLEGNGREIELGAFLSPEEREALCRDLEDALARLRTHGR